MVIGAHLQSLICSSTVSISADLDLRTICNLLGSVKSKWFEIGIQLGIPRHKLVEFRKEDDPLSAAIDYWLKGNVLDSVVPISWASIVAALKSEHVDETAVADRINSEYCQHKQRCQQEVTAKAECENGPLKGAL